MDFKKLADEIREKNNQIREFYKNGTIPAGVDPAVFIAERNELARREATIKNLEMSMSGSAKLRKKARKYFR